MFKKTFAKVALAGVLGSIGVAILPLKEVYASSSFNSSYANLCADKRVKYLTDYGSVTIGGSKVYNAFQYINGNCSSQHYSYYGNTVFFRRNYGEGIPVYSTIPTNGAYRGNNASKTSWSWSEIKENAEDSNGWYKNWAVKLNTLTCRGGVDGYEVGGSACAATILSEPNDYKSYNYKNGGMVPSGSKVEIRVTGYSKDGYSLDNSYLPMDMTNKASTNNTWKNLKAFLTDKPADKNVFNTTGKWKQARTVYDDSKNTVEYNKKLAAIQKLINMGQLSGKPADWAEMLSLKTDPTKESAIFVATRYNGAGYISVTLPAPEEYRIRNMMVTKLEIYKGSTIYGTMTRDKDTGTIKTEWKKNLTEGESYKVRVTVTSTGGMAPQNNKHYVVYKDKTYTKTQNTPLGGSVTIDNLDYTAPMNKDSDTISVSLGSGYGTDNQIKGDDSGSIKAGIDQLPEGDLGVHNVHLIEAATGKSVAYPIQGREYYIKYEVKYTGNNMPQNNLFNIPINVSYNTYVTQSGSNSLANKTVSKTLYPYEKNQPLTNGKIFTYRTDTFKATTSKVTTDFSISVPNYEYDINTNTKNDSGNGKWEAAFDIAVVPGSVSIKPGNYPGGDYCKPVVIKYKVQYNVPAGHTYNEAQTVPVVFNINGKTVTSYIQVYANQGQKEYSFTYNATNNCISSSGNVPIQIKVNPYKDLHESNYSNNQLSKDWVKKTLAKDYCATKTRENNSWTQKYYIISVNDAALGPNLDQFAGQETKNIPQNETFKITSVQFYSKYMKDKKLGNNGWVELLKSDGTFNGTVPTIKAGYGFDIKVTVEYTTNAFSTEDSANIKNLASNKTLYALHAASPLEDDLYLALKKSGSSDVVISAKGGNNQNGTKIQASASSSGSEKNKLTMTYTFKGVKISDTTPDGEYNLALYTKPIVGVIDKTEGSSVDILCDYLNVKFKVSGSVYDDVITGTIK